MNSTQFQALVVIKNDDGSYTRCLQWKTLGDLPEGEIVIEVDYSSLNYKDALSASGNHGVTRRYPHTPGIDAAGRVHSSTVEEFSPGDMVLCMGYDLGMNTFGAFSRYISVPAAWVMPLPSGLSTLESMQIGTAGFTAAQCVHRLIELGVTTDNGPVLVTGATGGVGSLTVRLLSSLQYEVTAVTGKFDQHQFLYAVGAGKIINFSGVVENCSCVVAGQVLLTRLVENIWPQPSREPAMMEWLQVAVMQLQEICP